MSREDIKFPLGDDLYLTLSHFNGVTRSHIRTFIPKPSLQDPSKTVVLPTKKGITLKMKQLIQLKNNIDSILSVWQEENEEERKKKKKTDINKNSSYHKDTEDNKENEINHQSFNPLFTNSYCYT